MHKWLHLQTSISQLRLSSFCKTFVNVFREASLLELMKMLPFEQRFPLLGETHLQLHLLNQAVPVNNHRSIISGKSYCNPWKMTSLAHWTTSAKQCSSGCKATASRTPLPSSPRDSLLLSTCGKGKIHLSPEIANGKAIALISDWMLFSTMLCDYEGKHDKE